MAEHPWIISVDDHVVEPPHLWQTYLPANLRDSGPKVVRDTCETISDPATRNVRYVKGGNGPMMDFWMFEGVPRPIPKVVACAGYPLEEHTVDPIAYEDMRPGCYEPKARLVDMDTNRTERSLCFPFITRFAGQLFLEAKDKVLALGVRKGLQRLDDRRVVRRLRRSATARVFSTAMGCEPCRRRSPSQRGTRDAWP